MTPGQMAERAAKMDEATYSVPVRHGARKTVV